MNDLRCVLKMLLACCDRDWLGVYLIACVWCGVGFMFMFYDVGLIDVTFGFALLLILAGYLLSE